jgi:hypothetical protein
VETQSTDIMKNSNKPEAPAPISTKNTAPKPHRTPQDVKRDNVRTDIGNDDPKILGR